ncbi:hypothetical protein [Comamonas sp.]|uniref:hypothetical protein n=1 Tax=Comamonas sp. TaxID=34028 RepID=UPI0028B19D0F|nr:hypothetical protein [Comamonas sp.]
MNQNDLKPYKPAINPGAARIRVRTAMLDNTYGRDPSILWQREEQIMGEDGVYRYVPMPPIYTAVTPEMLASTIDLIDLDTGEPLGQKLASVILVAGLGSLFIREDIEKAKQTLTDPAQRPAVAVAAP